MLTLVHLFATTTTTLVANVATLCINCFNIGFIILLNDLLIYNIFLYGYHGKHTIFYSIIT